MNGIGLLTLTVVASGLIALLTTPLVLAVARNLRLVDEPDARKVHKTAIPRIGGVAIMAGVILGTVPALVVAQFTHQIIPADLLASLTMLLITSSFIFAVGLADDLRSISSKFKAVALVLAAVVLSTSGVNIEVVLLNDRAWWEFNWLTTHIVTVTWIVGIAIAVNFIDGLDGLASGLVLLAAVVAAALLGAGGFVAAAVVPLGLASALAAFLVFNWRPAKVFMGDGGSLFIGFLIGGVTVMANPLLGSMKALFVPAAALAVPLIDTALTFYRRRYIQRRSMFAAERGHIHHMLLDAGLCHRHAVIAILGVSMVGTLIALAAMFAASWWAVAIGSTLIPLYYIFFRAAGSMRSGEMVKAFRSKRHMDRQQKRYVDHFHELQLEFNRVVDFSGWWQIVCQSAESLDFASLEIEMIGRDGEPKTLSWKPVDATDDTADRISATVPIAERRQGSTLLAKIEIMSGDSVESAGNRLSLFSRLISEYSVASLATRTVDGKTAAEHAPARTRVNGKLIRHSGTLTSGPLSGKRVALVHDFLYTYAGAERVLEQIVNLYPEADIFALFDFLPDDQRGFIKNKPVKTSFIQHLPLARSKHRAYLPVMPLAIEQIDVSGYDLVISSSYIAAKGIITGPDQVHLCYCHSPARYAWDLQHQYLDQKHLGYGPKGILSRAILHYIRNWDARSALGVDVFLANSRFVGKRIRKVYRRDTQVIYPPVDTEYFSPDPENTIEKDYYVTASRLVPYKKINLIVEAFNRMPDRKLIVVGEGPEQASIAAIAGPNIEMVGFQSADELRHYMRSAKAFVFTAEEDFGIVPVEAMACGTPVIAYGHGGVCETVRDGLTGRFFDEQTPEAIAEAVEAFEQDHTLDREVIAAHVRDRFSIKAFRERFQAVVTESLFSMQDKPQPKPTPDLFTSTRKH